MCNSVLDSMVQDGDPEQEMLVVEEQELPQTDPEPEMGAAAAAVCDAPPPHLRQSPSPTPGESTPNGEAIAADPPNVGQLLMVLLAQMNKMEISTCEIKTNINGMEDKMEGLNKEMSGMNNKMGTNTDKMEKNAG